MKDTVAEPEHPESPSKLGLQCYHLTDVGQRRSDNQDSYTLRKAKGGLLLVVADGMGGAKGGAKASSIAVNVVSRRAFDENGIISDVSLGNAIADANAEIYAAGQTYRCLSGMGTTLVSLVCTPERVFWANIGDSCLYFVRDGEVLKVSRDHTLIQEMVDSGVLPKIRAHNHPIGHMLTKALGLKDDVAMDLEMFDKQLEAGDIFVLCSDGLTNYVEVEELGEIIKEVTFEELARRLIDVCNERGGADNITVIVARVTKEEELVGESAAAEFTVLSTDYGTDCFTEFDLLDGESSGHDVVSAPDCRQQYDGGYDGSDLPHNGSEAMPIEYLPDDLGEEVLNKEYEQKDEQEVTVDLRTSGHPSCPAPPISIAPVVGASTSSTSQPLPQAKVVTTSPVSQTVVVKNYKSESESKSEQLAKVVHPHAHRSIAGWIFRGVVSLSAIAGIFFLVAFYIIRSTETVGQRGIETFIQEEDDGLGELQKMLSANPLTKDFSLIDSSPPDTNTISNTIGSPIGVSVGGGDGSGEQKPGTQIQGSGTSVEVAPDSQSSLRTVSYKDLVRERIWELSVKSRALSLRSRGEADLIRAHIEEQSQVVEVARNEVVEKFDAGKTQHEWWLERERMLASSPAPSESLVREIAKYDEEIGRSLAQLDTAIAEYVQVVLSWTENPLSLDAQERMTRVEEKISKIRSKLNSSTTNAVERNIKKLEAELIDLKLTKDKLDIDLARFARESGLMNYSHIDQDLLRAKKDKNSNELSRMSQYLKALEKLVSEEEEKKVLSAKIVQELRGGNAARP